MTNVVPFKTKSTVKDFLISLIQNLEDPFCDSEAYNITLVVEGKDGEVYTISAHNDALIRTIGAMDIAKDSLKMLYAMSMDDEEDYDDD